MNSFVMVVSHQWLGYNHPDPQGTQLHTLYTVLRRLRDGKVNHVTMDAFHERLYMRSFRTEANEWRSMLSNAYIWFDFYSQPQPTMSTCEEEKIKLQSELKRAVESIPSYVERSDCLVILTPGAVHADRLDTNTKRRAFVCYRTFRTRAFCVLEMFAAYLSRRKSTPTLLIRSVLSDPVYVSPLDCQKLALGLSHFTCCEQNHVTMSCSRDIAQNNMKLLIRSKINHLFVILKNIEIARW